MTADARAGNRTGAGIGLGLLALAWQKLAAGWPDDRLNLAVGMIVVGGSRSREVAARVVGPPVRLTGWCAAQAGKLPGANLVREPLSRGRRQLNDALGRVRSRGALVVTTSRDQAQRYLQANLDTALAWVEADIAPKMIDGLVPYLQAKVLPPLIAGSVPQIRADVVPVIIGDLTVDPRVRDLIVDQSRGVLTGATQEVRTTTEIADDRLESAVQRIFGRRPAPEGG